MKIDLSQFDGMTPGKWERRGKTIFVEGETALCVAVAEQHKPECAANARAIAALPDLIDELRNTESERAHHAIQASSLRTDLEYMTRERDEALENWERFKKLASDHRAELEARIEAAIKAEREACAKLCEREKTERTGGYHDGGNAALRAAAAAIRARSKK